MKNTKITAILLALIFILTPITQASAATRVERERRAVRRSREVRRTREVRRYNNKTVVVNNYRRPRPNRRPVVVNNYRRPRPVRRPVVVNNYYRPRPVRRPVVVNNYYRPRRVHHVYYPRPYYRNHYRYYDRYDDLAVAGGIGLLLGAVIASNNNDSQKRENERMEYNEAKAQAREACVNAVNTELQQLVKLLGETGVNDTLDFLKNYWGQKGTETFLDNRTNLAVLTIFSPKDNVRVEYTIMKDYKEASVKASNLKYNVSNERKTYYTEAKPEPAITKTLGIQFDDMKKDKFGCLVAVSVTPNSPAYYAGITAGDSIVKIDNYDTRQLRSEQISAYIEKQAGIKALIKIEFSTMGQKKKVDIRL